MNADEPVSLLPLVEGGDVGKADDGLPHLGLGHHELARCPWVRCRRAGREVRRGVRQALGLQFWQKPQGSVPAARTKNGPYDRICEGAIQLREPALIVAREIPVSVKNSGVVLNAVAVGNNGETRVE
jgi:hypothetical protein